jgi:hypothetical protein
MKWYGIVTLVFIFLVIGIVVGSFFMPQEGQESLKEFDFLSTYDCSKNYDQMNIMQNTDMKLGSNYSSYENYFYDHYELMENRCFITVKSWAHESLYEDLIWGTDWETLSYLNQIYLDEIPCYKNMDECELIKQQRDQYWDYLKLKNSLND